MSDFDELGGPPPLSDFEFDPESIPPGDVATPGDARRLWWAQGATPEMLLAVARAYAEHHGVLIPAEAGWEQAAFILGAIAQDEVSAADVALHLWRTSPGASGRLLTEPNGERRIGVTDAAEAAGVNRSFVKAEIRRGNLPAAKNAAGHWEIRMADFRAWLAQPGRKLRDTLTTAEAEALCGLAEGTVKKACQRGDIPCRKSGGAWLVAFEDVVARWPIA